VTSPDLSDRDVLELLDRNHKPEEIRTLQSAAPDSLVPKVVLIVRCMKCALPYPCPTRQAITEHEKEAFKARLKDLKEMWAKSCGRKEPHDEHGHTGFAVTYYCPGVDEPVDTLWTGTTTLDCEVHRSPHQSHDWTYNGQRVWCPGG